MKVRVSFELEKINSTINTADIIEWIKFELGETNTLSQNNIMSKHDLEAKNVKVLFEDRYLNNN